METWSNRDIDPVACEPGAVHVWTAYFSADARPPVEAEDCHLSDPEWVRFHRFTPGRPRETFAAGRFVLRRVLAQYLGCHPRDVPIGIDERGKPYLASPDYRLFFNLSHAWSFFAVAVSSEGEVGIDVEPASRRFDFDLVAPRVLSPSELSAVRGSAEPERAFLAFWTVKEAVAKASSLGLGLDMRSITLDVSPLTVPLHPLTASVEKFGTWSVMPFAIGEEGIAAVATGYAPGGIRPVWRTVSTTAGVFAAESRASVPRGMVHGR